MILSTEQLKKAREIVLKWNQRSNSTLPYFNDMEDDIAKMLAVQNQETTDRCVKIVEELFNFFSGDNEEVYRIAVQLTIKRMKEKVL